jgi:hypothetical protein
MPASQQHGLQLIGEALLFLFSWIVLAAIAIIISGKLIAKRVPLGFVEGDRFRINLVIFDMKARGDEVSLGFIVFIMSLSLCIVFGGKGAYLFFKAQSGIDIGQWSSLCAISSFLSIFCAVLIWTAALFVKGAPVVDQGARQEMLDRVQQIRDHHEEA